MINNINKEMDIIKKGYNIDDSSEEQADYKLLLKEKNFLSNSDITLSDEDRNALLIFMNVVLLITRKKCLI